MASITFRCLKPKKVIKLEFPPETTVGQIKEKLGKEQFQCEAKFIKLILNKKILSDDQTVQTLNITAKDFVIINVAAPPKKAAVVKDDTPPPPEQIANIPNAPANKSEEAAPEEKYEPPQYYELGIQNTEEDMRRNIKLVVKMGLSNSEFEKTLLNPTSTLKILSGKRVPMLKGFNPDAALQLRKEVMLKVYRIMLEMNHSFLENITLLEESKCRTEMDKVVARRYPNRFLESVDLKPEDFDCDAITNHQVEKQPDNEFILAFYQGLDEVIEKDYVPLLYGGNLSQRSMKDSNMLDSYYPSKADQEAIRRLHALAPRGSKMSRVARFYVEIGRNEMKAKEMILNGEITF